MINRIKEKQDSRDEDLHRLNAGEISANELRRENGLSSILPLKTFKIIAIGDRKLEEIK